MRSTSIRAALTLAATLTVLAGCATHTQTQPVQKAMVSAQAQNLPPYAAAATKGMVASVHPLATEAGVDAFRKGGNAIDAAVATALTLGVVNGYNSGIGGGCFVLIRTADGKFYAIDGREMAPSQASRDMYVKDGKASTRMSQTGALASGVPGSIAAYDKALQLGGKLKLADALEAGARIAAEGFPLDSAYARALRPQAKTIAEFPESARILLHPDGTPLKEGELLKQPDLANTYRAITRQGPGYFYGGEFAQKLEQWMRRNGGMLTAKDFANYQAKMRTPLRTTYRGYEIVGFPPPSSGGVHVAQILNILEKFDLAKMEKENPAQRIHVTAEAMKLAFADRAYWLGDPDYVKVPSELISKLYAEQLAARIDPTKAVAVTSHGTPPDANAKFFESHTTHLTAADADGNWVAITATVNTHFGSKVIIPGTGVIMNNQMDDFSIQPGVANAFKLIGSENNAVAAGKRPLSSMSPTIVLKDGKPFMTVGAAGGPTIITQVLQAITHVVDLNDSLPQALARPHFHQQWSPDELRIEQPTDKQKAERPNEVTPSTPKDITDQLQAMGQNVKPTGTTGATQAILQLPDGTFIGVHEPRLPGKAAGVNK